MNSSRGAEERLALVFGVMRAGQLVADLLELESSQGQALALDAGDDLADHPSLHTVGLDQHKSPLSHLAPLLLIASLCIVTGAVTADSVPVSAGLLLAGQQATALPAQHLGAQVGDHAPDHQEQQPDEPDRG